MNEITIEKNVPMPVEDGRSKYPWKEMEVGDSFSLPKLSISTGAVNERYKPKRFVSRKDGEGYRIWRIK